MFKRIFGQGSGGGPGPGPKPSVTSTNRTVDAIQKLGEVRPCLLLLVLVLAIDVTCGLRSFWHRLLGCGTVGVQQGALQALLS